MKSIVNKVNKDKNTITATEAPTSFKFNVVDGGSLLHKVVWQSGSKIKEIVSQYQKFANNYGETIVVFDPYENAPSTKDHEHLRRLIETGGCPNVVLELENVAHFSQNTFLNSQENKSQLIFYIAEVLTTDGHKVKICKGDADIEIVSAAIDAAISGNSVMLRADDTDVIIMLIYFWNNDMGNIVTQSEYVKNGKKQIKQINIKDVVLSFDRNTLRYILVIHAFGGCDTTSASPRKGKLAILQLVKKSKRAREFSPSFIKIPEAYRTPRQPSTKKCFCVIIDYAKTLHLSCLTGCSLRH